MLDDAFEALKKYDWGTDLAAVAADRRRRCRPRTATPQSARIWKTACSPPSRRDLSRDAHDYVCRKLTIVGTAASVPALAGLLGNKANSRTWRVTRSSGSTSPEAGQALRDALGTVSGNLKIGVISSLGLARDAAAVAPLGSLLRTDDPAVARAAALALGDDRHCRVGRGRCRAALPSADWRQAGCDRRAAGLCRSRSWPPTSTQKRRRFIKSLAGEQQPRWCVWRPRAACWPAPARG